MKRHIYSLALKIQNVHLWGIEIRAMSRVYCIAMQTH